MKVGELAPPLAGFGTGCVSQDRTGELNLVMWVPQSPRADQPRYLSGPDPGL